MSKKGQKSTPPTDLKDLKRLFDMLDTNNDGHLSRNEIKEMFRVAGFNPTNKELENAMSVMDSDKNCEIDFNEFVKIMEESKLSRDPEQQSQELKQAFEKFDMNGDGLIDKEEFKRIMQLGQDPVMEDLDEIWAQWDKNKDGFIEYKEFVTMWTSI